MKIYTKKGDTGTTQLIGGKRVAKNHIRIEAYGTIDELNSYVGLLRDHKIDSNSISTLIEIQDRLFTIGALLANESNTKIELPKLNEKDVELLENNIDKMNEVLPEMKSFVLPGGDKLVSYCHITRCVCRRSERLTTLLPSDTDQFELILKYLNRLSDYLFVLSRFITHLRDAKEIPWEPRK
jgi:cob(I)alamin adenosyltransferase